MRARRRSGLLLVVGLVIGPALVPDGASSTSYDYGTGAPDGGPSLAPAEAGAPIQGTLRAGGWIGNPPDIAGQAWIDQREFILTDHPFDDTGPDIGLQLEAADHTSRLDFVDQADTPIDGKSAPSGKFGDYSYPDDVVAGTADIVEARIAADEEAWYVLVVLGALADPSLVALEVSIGDAAIQFGGTASVPQGVLVHADSAQNHIEMRVPRAVLDPGIERRPVTIGAGLWDAGSGEWHQPEFVERPRPFFDLAYVPNERLSSYWNDREQSRVLASGDLADGTFTVNFADLLTDSCRGDLCASFEPFGGLQVRIFRSGQQLGEGIVPQSDPVHNAWAPGARIYRSRVQPYAVYAPTDFDAPHPLVLLLHPEGGNHMSYVLSAWPEMRQWVDLLDAVVAMPMARGENGWYEAASEKDVFEVWRDVAAHYPVDRERVYLMGVGMGGFGALRLAHLYPDQFARVITWGAPIIPNATWPAPAPVTFPQANPPMCESEQPSCGYTLEGLFGNARNVPTLLVYGGMDERVPATGPETWVPLLGKSGTPYRYLLYPSQRAPTRYPGGHGDLILEWLAGRPRRATRPSHVTYTILRDLFDADYGLAYGDAYWLRDMRLSEGTSMGIIRAALTTDEAGDSVLSPSPGSDDFGSYVQREHIFEAVESDRNLLMLDMTGIDRLRVELDQAGWDTRIEGAMHGSASAPTDVLLSGAFYQGVTVEGLPFDVMPSGLLLHVPAGSFEAHITP